MTLNEIFSSSFLREIVLRAIIVGLCTAIPASLLGVSLVMKRYSMIGDGLSHVGYFALAIGAVAGVSAKFSLEAAIPIVILAAILILKLDDSPKISGDAACAVVSTGAVALGTIIFGLAGTSTSDICSSLFGSSSIITVTNKDMILSIALSVVVVVWFVLFYRQIFAVTFDSQFATSAGCNASGLRTTLAVLTAVTIVIGMKMMGAIMISALIVFPTLAATQICKSFKGVVICACVSSSVCFLVGFTAACLLSLQTGAAVVSVELVMFVLFCMAAKVKNIINRKRIAEENK